MKNIISGIVLIAGFFTMFFVSCKDDIDPVITEINYDRLLSVTDLEADVVNTWFAEVNFTENENADYYVVQFYNDSISDFNNDTLTSSSSIFVLQDTIAADDISLPLTYEFETEEKYSVRVQVLSDNIELSKWSGVTFETNAEDLFKSLYVDNIGNTDVTLKWDVDSDVDYFIVSADGAEDKTLRMVDDLGMTEEEIAAGTVTITGLSPYTEYTIKLYSDSKVKKRGSVTFTTFPGEEYEIPEGTDVADYINNSSNNVFVLKAGVDYTCGSTIKIDRDITILGRGEKVQLFDGKSTMPILEDAVFQLTSATAANFIVKNVELDGNSGSTKMISNSASAFGDMSFSGCYMHDYKNNLFYYGKSDFIMNSVSFDDCIIADFTGTLVDLRQGFISNISFTNSTICNCASANFIVRMDGADKGPNTLDDGTNSPKVTFADCSFYNNMSGQSETKQYLYIRWNNSTPIYSIKNNIFAGSSAINCTTYSASESFAIPSVSMAGNYYYLSANMIAQDEKGYELSTEPFTDPDNYDFTIKDANDAKDADTGDPRWY